MLGVRRKNDIQREHIQSIVNHNKISREVKLAPSMPHVAEEK